MSVPETGRHRLPLLVIAQASKELTHNEALARLDALVHPVCVDQVNIPPEPGNSDIGKCWLIGASPLAEWVGKSGQIAYWIGGGWRYLVPVEGMRSRILPTGLDAVFSDGQWHFPPAIVDPTAGAVIDMQARTAITTLLSYFRMIGLVT